MQWQNQKSGQIARKRRHSFGVLTSESSGKPLLDALYASGIYSILVEGGARVAGSALEARIVQKAAFFVAPLFIGEGKSALSGFEVGDLQDAPRLQDVQIEPLGVDVLVEGYLPSLPH